LRSGFSSEYKRATTEEIQKTHGHIWGIGILKIIGFDPTSAKERDLSYVEGKIKFHFLTILGSSIFRPQNFRQEVSVEKLATSLFL
jgi:hypothetical protein